MLLGLRMTLLRDCPSDVTCEGVVIVTRSTTDPHCYFGFGSIGVLVQVGIMSTASFCCLVPASSELGGVHDVGGLVT